MTKRERFLDWIRNGDPNDLPVCMSWGEDTAASFYGKDHSEVTVEDQISVAEETGIFNIYHVHMPMPFVAADFLDDVSIHEEWDHSPDGVKRQTKTLVTPAGKLTSITEFPKDIGAHNREFYVKGPEDMSVLEDFIRRSCSEIIRNPEVAEKVKKESEEAILSLHGDMPSACHVFCSAVELFSCYYMDQTTALYLSVDFQDLFEELMELHGKTTDVWMDTLANTGLDIYTYAINGYEWLSPSLYNRYMIPQAKRINERAAEQGKLSWLHTCGKLKHIAKAGMYHQMGVDVLESLASLPTGDIDNLAETRREIGPDIVTRGGMNVELFYADDPSVVREKAEEVIAATSGYKHMIGDTNGTYPAYPWANIQALLDVVKSSGRMYV